MKLNPNAGGFEVVCGHFGLHEVVNAADRTPKSIVFYNRSYKEPRRFSVPGVTYA